MYYFYNVMMNNGCDVMFWATILYVQ